MDCPSDSPDNSTPDSTVSFDTDDESPQKPVCKPSPRKMRRLPSKESDQPIIDSTQIDSDESSISTASGILKLLLQKQGDSTQSCSGIETGSSSDTSDRQHLIDRALVDTDDVSLSEVERDFYEQLSPTRIKRDASGIEKESPTTDKPSIQSMLRADRKEMSISEEASEATSKKLERLDIKGGKGKKTDSPSKTTGLPQVDLTSMFDSDDPDGSPRKRLRGRGKSLPDPTLPQIDLTPRFSLEDKPDEDKPEKVTSLIKKINSTTL